MLQNPPTFNFTRRHHISQKPIYSIPCILIDFTAMTLCDLIPTRKKNRSLPEFVFFVQKVTHQAHIHVRTLLVALIYLKRAKSNLPKRAVGNDDTTHRMFLASLLLASKFLQDTTWTAHALSNRRVYEICGGLFSLQEINQFERGFLKLIQYDCYVDDQALHQFVESNRSDFSL
ncbi:cyclin domain-containing protein [Gilbertella persicaria]|uniref:cyclin domain-containing protein n=1 Tax=Gilbertella persicaria TaxID=101096 RepID=UPI00221FE080|nr:cyclin domain-containing protein [Gilbertella persicaria]KAI8091259.1 cyclin domain-containing protein [Gilbertella persicaria]